jgi:hypothetical protein
MKKYFLLTLVLLVTACASVPATVPKSLQVEAAGKSGLVFGSIANGEGIHYSVFGLRYRAVGSKEEGEFRYMHDWMHIANTKSDFERDDAEGSVFSAHLPPGNYELFNVRFFENRGSMGTTTFTSKVDFSVPFSVEEGKATYLGEYVGQRLTGRSIIYLPVSAGGYYVVSDQMERDIAILERRGETVPRDGVQNVVSKVIEANVPLLRKEVIPEK